MQFSTTNSPASNCWPFFVLERHQIILTPSDLPSPRRQNTLHQFVTASIKKTLPLTLLAIKIDNPQTARRDLMTPPSTFQKTAVARTPEERFQDYLQSRGMRNTQQRQILLDVVFQQHDHFDADQLLERMPPKGHKGHVSRPTIYRTLAEFVDAGLLRKFELSGRSVYEHDYGYPQHDHLHCLKCDQLIEFQSPELIALRDAVAKENGFQVKSHRLIISGTCESCRNSRTRVRRRVDRI
jgi:Fur family ferric uptake transcriptional regulator